MSLSGRHLRPFDLKLRLLELLASPAMSNFEYFISYNSHNVVLARRLTERLLGDGHSTWFNEYQVHSDQQDEFQLLINRGVDQSTHAILVVGASYAASPYCNVEVERILRRIPMNRIHLYEIDQGGVRRLLTLYPELGEAVRWPSEPAPDIILGRHEWHLSGTGLSLDDSILSAEPKDQFQSHTWSDAFAMAGLHGRAEHQVWTTTEALNARLVVHVAELNGREAEHIRARYTVPDEDAEILDRARLKEELQYFQREARSVFSAATHHASDRVDSGAARGAWAQWRGEMQELGVHLFSSTVAGRAIKQRLFSFRLTALPAIFRVYKLSFLHPLLNDAPFVVRFVFRFPDDERAFFSSIPWCDALVTSLRIRSSRPPATKEFLDGTSDFARRMRGKHGG